MTSDTNGTLIIDEIDRLFVVYEKAKNYVNKISTGIDEQIALWQYRRQIIVDQMKSSSSSLDFLLPKTQRMNELSIEAVQALCRVDLLIEQVLRLDPKSLTQSRTMPTSTSFSARSIDTNHSHSTANIIVPDRHQPNPSPSVNSTRQQAYGFPIPVLRNQQTPSGRLPVVTTYEKSGFKPIEQQYSSIISDTTSRPTPIHPQTNHYPATESINFSMASPRMPQSAHVASPLVAQPTTRMNSNYPSPREKVKVKLQRIPPGTKWKQARIDIIDSLSAFYVENYEPKVQEKFVQMFEGLHNYYNQLEQTKKLVPLENISIGDFGVVKYSEDNRWYRARLLMCEEQDRIRIVFIDFGNIETKYMQEFFPLDKLYTDLPAQAIACTLSEAYPRTPADNKSLWPADTIQIFRKEVTEKTIEVVFINLEEGTEQWPLHFVRLIVDNQIVTNSPSLKQRIEPRPNRFIAEQLANSLKQQEYILFNVPIGDDEFEQ